MSRPWPYQGRFGPVYTPPDLLLWLRADQGISVSDGAPVTSWVSIEGSAHDFVQATSDKQPTFAASVNSLNDKPAVLFDGVDDLLAKTSGFLTGQQGTVFAAVKLNENTMIQTAIASADEASSALFWICRAVTTVSLMQMCTQDGITQNQINSDITVDTNRSIMMWSSNESAYELRLNGNAITEAVGSGSDDGMWLSDISDRDNTTIGALKFAAGEVQFLKGYIAEIRVYNRALYSAEISTIEAELLERYTPSNVPDMDAWFVPLARPTLRKSRVRPGYSEVDFREIIVAPAIPDLILVLGELPQRHRPSRRHVQFDNFFAVAIPAMGSWYEPLGEPVIAVSLVPEGWQGFTNISEVVLPNVPEIASIGYRVADTRLFFVVSDQE